MKKYLKLVSAALAVIGTIMMFFTQVTCTWNHAPYHTESLGIAALIGGDSKYGVNFTGVSSGLAGYILLGVAAIILLIVALVPYFKEHDMLSAVVTGLAVVCAIVGVIMIFLIRKNFAENNGPFKECVVGWAMIAGGSLGSLSALAGGASIIFDVNGAN